MEEIKYILYGKFPCITPNTDFIKNYFAYHPEMRRSRETFLIIRPQEYDTELSTGTPTVTAKPLDRQKKRQFRGRSSNLHEVENLRTRFPIFSRGYSAKKFLFSIDREKTSVALPRSCFRRNPILLAKSVREIC